MRFPGDSAEVFLVVVNDEERHSIWPADRPPPAGWRRLEARGTREECLDFINRAWIDMRPKSTRSRG